MNLVDSSGWLEYFAGGPDAEFFASPVKDTKRLLVPTVVLLEVRKAIIRQKGKSAAATALGAMATAEVIPLDAELATSAAHLGLKHNLPLADSIVYATALARRADVWTMDPDFKGLQGVQLRPRRR